MGTEREISNELTGDGRATGASRRAFSLTRRERRELARRFRKLLEAHVRAREPGRSARALRMPLSAAGAALAMLVASSADPATAEATVTSSVSSGTLTVTSDGAD